MDGGRSIEGGLGQVEAAAIAIGALGAADLIPLGGLQTSFRIAARQGHLFVAISFGFVDQAILLFECRGDFAKRVHHFERRVHIQQFHADDINARAVAIEFLLAARP